MTKTFLSVIVFLLVTVAINFAQTGFVVVPGGIGISAVDKLALDDSIIDIHAWAESAVRQKVDNCRDRMIATWYPRLLEDAGITSIPNSKDALISLIGSRPWYKNRTQRDSLEALRRP